MGKTMRKAGAVGLALLVAVVLAFALAVSGAGVLGTGVAYAADLGAAQVSTQATVTDAGTSKLKTNASGVASLTVKISKAGTYSISSTASTGVGCDTVGYLYDGSSNLVAYNDDRHADKNFCICQKLAAGTYTLRVSGKEHQASASITVSVVKATQMAAVDCRYTYKDTTMSKCELGTWTKSDTGATWTALKSSSYTIVGYADREVFAHAAENGAVGNIQWKSGKPKAYGDFVMKVSSSGKNASYVGDAYYIIENPCTTQGNASYYEYDLARMDVQVAYAICGGVSSVSLGHEAVETPNRNTYWTHVGEKYFKVAGFVSRAKLEKAGDPAKVTWTKGLPNQEGEFVIKVVASSVSKNPYFGTRYIWANLEDVHHAGSGKWVVDKKATYTATGKRHLVCKYCGGECNVQALPKLSGAKAGSVVTVGKAQYKVGSDLTVTYQKPTASTSVKSATVPNTVKINGETYAVTGIAAKAFAGYPSLTTVTIKATELTKAKVKNCFSGSAVTTVKVPAAQKADYQTYFTGVTVK